MSEEPNGNSSEKTGASSLGRREFLRLLATTGMIGALPSVFLSACAPAAAPPATATVVSSTAASSSSPTASSQAQGVQILKVGNTEPYNVATGVETKKGLELLVDDFNNSGGITIKAQKYQIQLVSYDDKYSTDGGKAAAERLVNQDNVKYIVGQYFSGAILGTQTVTEPAKVLVFSSGASDNIVAPSTKYTFRANWATVDMVKWLYVTKTFSNIKTVVHTGGDNETGHSRGDLLEKMAKQFGFKVADHFYLPSNTKDFSAMAARIAAIKPDVLDTAGWAGGADLGLILKALAQTGWKGPILTGYWYPQDFLPVAGAQAAEGVIGATQDLNGLVTEPPAVVVKLKQLYEAKYGAGSWNSNAVVGLPGWDLFLAALKKADSIDPDDIRAALANGVAFDAHTGPAMMVKRPDVGTKRFVDSLTPQPIVRFENGKTVLKTIITPEDGLKFIESVFGFAGEWK